MKVNNKEKKNNNTEVEVKVDISAEEFNAAVNKAYVKMRGRINVPGWRKGKAPRKLIESMYGETVFYDDALDTLSRDALELVLAEDDTRYVGTPAVSDFFVNEDKSAWISLLLTLYPEITLGEYKGIEAPKAAVEVTDEEIDAQIASVRERNARIINVERAAALGDTVDIAYKGTIDGTEFTGGSSDSYNLELGSGSFIPGFEEQVVGMSAGEEKDINVTFPEDYHSDDLSGKAAVFHVKVASVSEKQLPELDDEFAKDVSEFDTFAEYRDDVAADLKNSKEAAADNVFRSAVLEKIADNAQCEIPEAMIDDRVDSYINNYAASLQAQGIGLDMYLQLMGSNLDEFKKNLRPSIQKTVRVDLALEAIAKAENIVPTAEDIEKEYKSIADEYNMDVADVKKAIAEADISADVTKKMTEDFVVSLAIATEPVEETAEEAAAEEAAEEKAE